MADADDAIAQALRRAGWRQGDLIPPADAAVLLSESVDQCLVTASDLLWLVILSQDCDLLNRECSKEPYVELIAARQIERGDPQLETGQSARRLHLPTRGSITWLDCSIHDRFRIPKAALTRITRTTTTALPHEACRQLCKWVARRYTRRPFPDAFEERLDARRNPVRKLFKHPAAKLIAAVYIATSNDELPAETPYAIDVLLTARECHLAEPEFSEAIDTFEQEVLETFGSRPGITFAQIDGQPALAVISEDNLTQGQIRRYKRFDADYRSSDEDAVSPPDGVDET